MLVSLFDQSRGVGHPGEACRNVDPKESQGLHSQHLFAVDVQLCVAGCILPEVQDEFPSLSDVYNSVISVNQISGLVVLS